MFLLERCIEIAVLAAFAVLPILAVSASQKGYLFPVGVTLVYVFAGFLITPVNSFLHPLSCILVIIARNWAISDLALPQAHIPLALASICIWSILSVLLANIKLGKIK